MRALSHKKIVSALLLLSVLVLFVPPTADGLFSIPPTPAWKVFSFNDTINTPFNITASTYNDEADIRSDGSINFSYTQVAGGGGGADCGSSGWYSDTDFTKCIPLTINSTLVSATQTGFPLLVNKTITELIGDIQTDCDDLVFTDSSNNKLSHELVSCDPTTGYIQTWLNATSISSSSDTEVKLFYANPTASDQSDADNVFTDAVAVYHLQANATMQASVSDSTSNNNDGFTMGTGYYRDFDGVSDKITVTDHSSIQNIFSGGGTAGAWIMPESDGETVTGGRILYKAQNADGWFFTLKNESNGYTDLSFIKFFSGQYGEWITTNTVIPLHVPSRVIVTYDDSSTTNDPTFWINGVEYTVGSGLDEVFTPTGTAGSDVAEEFVIGNDSVGAKTFEGGIWDAFLDNAVMSDADIATDYNSHGIDLTAMQAYYPMDEDAGNIRNVGAGGAGEGTNSGSTVTLGRIDYGARPVYDSGRSWNLDFDSVNDKITVTDHSSIQDIFSGGGTVGAWIMPDSDGEGSNGRILDKRDSGGTSGWILYLGSESNGKAKVFFLVHFSGGLQYWTTDDLALSLHTPNRVAVKYDSDSTSNTPTIFVNGVSYAVTKQASGSGSYSSDAGDDLIIGNDVGTTRTFDGGIWDVFLENSILSDAVIQSDYNNGDLADGDVVARYKLDEGTGTSVANSGSGAAGSGTVSGATWTTGRTHWDSRFVAEGVGNAYNFEGTSSHIRVPHISDLDGIGALSVFAVAKQTVIDQPEPLWSSGVSTSDRIEVLPWQDGNMYVIMGDGTNSYGYFDYSSAISSNTVFSSGYVFDGSESGNANRLKIYTDGSQNTFTSFVGTIGTTTPTILGQPFVLGNRLYLTNHNQLDGSISEVLVFNVEKDSDFMSAMHNNALDATFVSVGSEVVYSAGGGGDPTEYVTIYINTPQSSILGGLYNMTCSLTTVVTGVNGSGYLTCSEVPDPTASTKGGVLSQSCTGGEYMTGINTDGSIICAP